MNQVNFIQIERVLVSNFIIFKLIVGNEKCKCYGNEGERKRKNSKNTQQLKSETPLSE